MAHGFEAEIRRPFTLLRLTDEVADTLGRLLGAHPGRLEFKAERWNADDEPIGGPFRIGPDRLLLGPTGKSAHVTFTLAGHTTATASIVHDQVHSELSDRTAASELLALAAMVAMVELGDGAWDVASLLPAGPSGAMSHRWSQPPTPGEVVARLQNPPGQTGHVDVLSRRVLRRSPMFATWVVVQRSDEDLTPFTA